MSTDNLDKDTKNISTENYINQIKMLSENSEEASTHSLVLHKTLQDSINSIMIGSDNISDMIEKIQLLIVRSNLVALTAISNAADVTRQGDEISDITSKLNSLSELINESLNMVVEASMDIIHDSKRCSHIVKETTEKIEITELSAQFVSHFVGDIETFISSTDQSH